MPEKHLADGGEWDRTSLLQIFFFLVPEERSLFLIAKRLAEECSWTEFRHKDNGHCMLAHACSAVWQ